MSRIAKLPVKLSSGVEITLSNEYVVVKGPLGILQQRLSPGVEVLQRDGNLFIGKSDETQRAKAMSGTIRAILQNMVVGVTKGFEKKLLLVGVGYRAQAVGDSLNLSLGFSHPVVHKMPKGIKVESPSQTEIIVKGIDKALVGQVAADIRFYRKPEPYKGKGVRYADELVILKETKKK